MIHTTIMIGLVSRVPAMKAQPPYGRKKNGSNKIILPETTNLRSGRYVHGASNLFAKLGWRKNFNRFGEEVTPQYMELEAIWRPWLEEKSNYVTITEDAAFSSCQYCQNLSPFDPNPRDSEEHEEREEAMGEDFTTHVSMQSKKLQAWKQEKNEENERERKIHEAQLSKYIQTGVAESEDQRKLFSRLQKYKPYVNPKIQNVYQSPYVYCVIGKCMYNGASGSILDDMHDFYKLLPKHVDDQKFCKYTRSICHFCLRNSLINKINNVDGKKGVWQIGDLNYEFLNLMKCPDGCDHKLSESDIEKILIPHTAPFLKYKRRKAELYLIQNGGIQCKKCESPIWPSQMGPLCASINCPQCANSMKRVKRSKGTNEVKPCPKCDLMAAKSGASCSHMNCPECGCGWCWLCLKETIHGKIEHVTGGHCEARGHEEISPEEATRELLFGRRRKRNKRSRRLASSRTMERLTLSEAEGVREKPGVHEKRGLA